MRAPTPIPTREPLRPPNSEPEVCEVAPTRPLRWLAAGWRDLRAMPGPSLAHGLVVALGGWAIVAVAREAWLLLPGAISGFLLVGPILATGLYELSRRHAAGRPAGFAQVVAAWRPAAVPLVGFGLAMFAAATAWVLFTALLLRAFVPGEVRSGIDLLRYAVADQGTTLFWMWVLAGGLGAALVFALSWVSVPLMLDREITLRRALRCSVRAAGRNPVAAAGWAALIMLLSAASIATAMLGFVVVVPLVGHATWHAYRDVVDVDGCEPRTRRAR